MFNFWGTHKIGILGDANSGKTVFLTSLLWNLEDRKLKLGRKLQAPTGIQIHNPKNEHDFDYDGHKRDCQEQKLWPAKTVEDYSLATCSYELDSFFKRKLTFVDIPGERMADLLIWQCNDYADWSVEMLRSWKSSPIISAYMQEYEKLLSKEKASLEELSWEYKKGMRKLLLNYIPQISPSTLFFNNGKEAKMEDINSDIWLKNRSIWYHGDEAHDFFPLLIDWKEKDKELYVSCEKNYKLYRNKIIKPLFSQIGSCDNFIICIDILGILSLSPGAYLKTKEELKCFIKKIAPGFWKKLLNGIGRNPPRIAFVATKSDLVYGEDLQHLRDLLEELVDPFVTKEIQFGYFTCTAWNSTKKAEDSNHAIYTIKVKGDDGQDQYRLAVMNCSPLPDEWPDNWNGEEFADFNQPMLPNIVKTKAPKQTGIDAILNFVTGDGNE